MSVESTSWGCFAACQSLLTFTHEVVVTVSGFDTGMGPLVQRGWLTAAGEAEVARVDAGLVAVPSFPAVDIVTTTDGGLLSLVLRHDDGTTSEADWLEGSPPPELQDVDALFDDLEWALFTCEGSDWVLPNPTCRPVF